MRKVNWLNLDKLIYAINISGTTDIIISKIDILQNLNLFNLFYDKELINFKTIKEMKTFIIERLNDTCIYLENIIFSDNKEIV